MTVPPHIEYRGGRLHIEDVALDRVAERFGTPTYVYSRAALCDNLAAYTRACRGHDALVCYAVKANSNIAVLNLLAHQEAGFDIVSGGELARVLAAQGDPKKVIFSGVGKSRDELAFALQHEILCFNVESISELRLLDAVARDEGKIAPVSLRVNPDVDARTHPYIATGLRESKFGIPYEDALACYREAAQLRHLEVIGIDCHIGSQLLDAAPLMMALDKLIELADALRGLNITLRHLDLGGGLGIRYKDEEPIAVETYLAAVFERVAQWRKISHQGKPLKLIFEPGRSIAGTAGVLISKVRYLKTGSHKNFAVVDAAMNDLIRPAMYDAWHEVLPFLQANAGPKEWDLVGPVCESGDWLAKGRTLALSEGDLLAFLNSGAYAMAMASNYNTRPRAAEVMIDGGELHLIRERESIKDLLAGERLLPM